MSIRSLDHQLVTIVPQNCLIQAVHPGLLTAANVGPVMEAMLSLMEWLDERARLLLDRDGTVLSSGSGVADSVARCDCLTLSGRTLQPATREASAVFDALLKVPIGAIETRLVQRRGNEGHCILRAAGLCEQAVMLTLQIAHDGFIPRLADLEIAFGLTPSEAHVVERLQQGLSPQKIGDELGISVHTVRAHLRHAYDKLGVSSREELSRRLAPYRLN